MPEGRFVDAAAILLMTTASLCTGMRLHPGGAWDPRRFRPNILVDVEGEGWLEDSWVGRPVRVGAATVIPSQPCVRCTMVTRSQPGLDADVDIFRTLARHHRGHFGVWSDVFAPGSLSVGQLVEVGGQLS
jgi:uncharacterized protein YcbX